MRELDCEESWAPKKWCFWTVVLEKTLESPLDFKEIKQVNPRENQSWIFIGRTDAEETPVLWPPHAKGWLIWKDPDAGKDWGQEEKRMTEDEMAGRHHRFNGHWVWVNSGSWWWTGKPGVVQSMGLQRVGHNWVTELYWTVVNIPDLRQILNSLIWQSMKQKNPGPCTVTIWPIKCFLSEILPGTMEKASWYIRQTEDKKADNRDSSTWGKIKRAHCSEGLNNFCYWGP